jgi:adenylate cyclase
MQLSSMLTWLVDAASASPGADRFLGELGTRLIADELPLAGGALTLAVPHPIIARRTWLWRAENGAVIEAVGFAGFGGVGPLNSSGDAGRSWLAALAGGEVHEDIVGSGPDAPVLGWIGPRPFTEAETGRLREAARFAAAPLAALSARATLNAALEAYLGRRSAAPRCSMLICAASPRCPRPSRRRLSSPRWAPGSTASPAPFTPSAARC